VIEIVKQRLQEGRIFEESQKESNCLESLILIDRLSDVVTPFCTPFTYFLLRLLLLIRYQALLNQMFSIK